MSKQAAAVMRNASNMTQTVAKLICCHLSFTLGARIKVPMEEVNILGDGYVEPFFDSFLYETTIKKGNCWVSDLSNIIANDVSRVMNYNSDNKNEVTYRYESKFRRHCM